MSLPKIYSHQELLKRKFAQVRKARKDWICQRCTVSIAAFDENETSWTADRTEMIRLCLICVGELKEPPAFDGHQKILEIDERQTKIAELYVLLTNLGEALKNEYKFPSGSPARLENGTDRYLAITDGMLSKTESVENIASLLSNKKS